MLTWNVQGVARRRRRRGGRRHRGAAPRRGRPPGDPAPPGAAAGRRRCRCVAPLGASSTGRCVHRAEGLAVLSPHRLVRGERRSCCAGHRSGTGGGASVSTSPSSSAIAPFGCVDVHLSPHDDETARRREAGCSFERAARPRAGDRRRRPQRVCPVRSPSAPLRRPDGSMRGRRSTATRRCRGDELDGRPRRGRPPTQRIDYVLAPPGAVMVARGDRDGRRLGAHRVRSPALTTCPSSPWSPRTVDRRDRRGAPCWRRCASCWRRPRRPTTSTRRRAFAAKAAA